MIITVAYKTNYTSVLNAAQPICYIHSLVFEYLRGHQIHVVPLFSLQDNQKSFIEYYFFLGNVLLHHKHVGVVVFQTTTPTNVWFHQIPQKLEFSAISCNFSLDRI